MRSQRKSEILTYGALALLVGTYFAVLAVHRSRSVGGSDSSGYWNSAKAIAAGEPVQAIEPLARFGMPAEDQHLFIPLGYVPGPRPGTMATFYPIGLPLQILPAAALFGWPLGPFLLSPFFSAASVLLLFFLARSLGATRIGSLACAAMLAASPVLAFQGVQLMSDTAAAAWALASVLCAVMARRRVSWSIAAGFAFGVGVLVRPASAVLWIPLVFAMPFRPRAWLLFLAGGSPCAAAFFAFNRACYGGAWKTGYGAGGALADFAVSNFLPRFRHYLYWIAAMMTPLPLAGWLLSGADSRRPLRTRLMLLSWFLTFFLLYCFYGPYETWWYTRYLLPAFPALLLGSVLATEDLLAVLRERAAGGMPIARGGVTGRFTRVAPVAALLAAAAVGVAGVRLARRYAVLDLGHGQAVYPESIRWAATRVPEPSVVLAMEFSGAMRSYSWGTFVRWDYIDAGRFPELVRRFREKGCGIYALVFPYEVREAIPRVPGVWTYLGSNREVSLWRLESP